MNQYRPITDIGKNFIRRIYDDNPTIITHGGVYNKKRNILLDGYTFTSQCYINGYQDIINWIEKHSKRYNIDANIVAANTYEESRYIFWNYSSSPALGISQIVRTKWEDLYNSRTRIITLDEREKIFRGINTVNDVRDDNKIHILHQNIMDFPEISIIYQCHILHNIAYERNTGGLASTAILCYNQGEGFAKSDFELSLSNLRSRRPSSDYEQGIEHVIKIFERLKSSFGYNMTLRGL